MVLLATLLAQTAYSQLMYRSRYKSAIVAEGFGLSPIMSVNYEIAPIRYHKSFATARLGFGYLPAGFGQGAGFSIPMGASYNILINNLKKGLTSRVMNKCKSKPPLFDLEYFLELGGGYARIIYPTSTNRNYFNLVAAFRTHLVIDIPPKPKVFQLKISVTPRVRRSGLVFYEASPTGGQNFYGGFSLGFSI